MAPVLPHFIEPLLPSFMEPSAIPHGVVAILRGPRVPRLKAS
jgi:hypothetical protein